MSFFNNIFFKREFWFHGPGDSDEDDIGGDLDPDFDDK